MNVPTLFDGWDRLRALIEQYDRDLAETGWTGFVRCAACGDRLRPSDHVLDRRNELHDRLATTVLPTEHQRDMARPISVATYDGHHPKHGGTRARPTSSDPAIDPTIPAHGFVPPNRSAFA